MTQKVIENAILVLSSVPKGQSFILRDLVPPIIWHSLETYTRATLGTKFYSWAVNEGSLIVRPIDKTDEEQQRYLIL